MIGWNNQSQSNKQFNFNPKRGGTKSSNTQCSQKTPSHEKLRMQSTLISRFKKKMSLKNRRECNQEITVAETAIKSFENNKSHGNDGLAAEFHKNVNKILKIDLQPWS